MPSLHQAIKSHRKALRSKSRQDDVTVGDGWAEGWIGPAVIDRSGEYVPPDQWILDDHKKNPVGFVNHKHADVPLIRWEHPDGKYSIERRANGLFGRAYFNLEIPEGRELYKSYQSGHMRGFSPGFVSERPVRGHVNGKPASILNKAKLFEVSAVGIPDNQDALVTNCKAMSIVFGKNKYPADNVVRFGAIKMAEDIGDLTASEEVVREKSGVGGFLDTMVSGLTAVFSEAKACLASEPEDKRNEAYSLVADAYLSLKSMCNFGRVHFKSMEWDEAEKAIEKEFEGFGEAVKKQDEEDAGMDETQLKSFIGEIVTKHMEEPLSRIAKIEEVADNHEAAIEGIIEAVEPVLAS